VDALRRLREPAAFGVLVVLLLQVLIEWVGYVLDGSVRSRMPETLTILVLGLVVASCVLGERTAHARMLTVLALIGAVLSILTSMTLAIIAPATEPESPVIAWLDLLLDLVVPLLVVLGLAKLLPRRPAAQGTTLPSPAIADAGLTDAAPAALPSTQVEPVWQADAASGVAWHTAGDAALGAPASGWGTPGEASGWHPIADDDPSGGDRSGEES
jgi:hypothetical protein